MQECRIAAMDLACRRGERVLFSGVAFTLAPGQALHVVGPNGTGKTSLIRIVAGLLPAWSGRIEREGETGLLDERHALDGSLPLRKALAFWQRLDGPADDRLALLGLADLLDVPVGYFSTGQKKRAAFARLIGQHAPVWLLDEPLNGLDADGAALVQELAGEHCRAGGICVIASHQPFTLPGIAQLDLADFAP
jgi:heme exporter protein A